MPFPVNVLPRSYIFERLPRWADVYWYDFGIPRAQQHTMADPHLAIVVSDPAITLRGTVLVVPLSGAEHRRQGYEFHVPITRAEVPRLDKDSIAQVDQIYCIPTRPGLPDQYYLTHLERTIMKRVYEAMLRALGVNYLIKSGSS